MNHILIVTDYFYPKPGASANCIYSIFDDMEDAEVTVVCRKEDVSARKEERYKNYQILRVGNRSAFWYKSLTHIEKWFMKSGVSLTDVLLYKKAFRKVHRKKSFDCIFSVSANISTSVAAYQWKKKHQNERFVMYQVDPYAGNLCLPEQYKNARRALEKKIYRYADDVITTDIIRDELAEHQLEIYREKVHALEFPCVRYIPESKAEPVPLSKDHINCVFVGYVYRNVRSPKFMLECLKRLDDRFRVYLIGQTGNDIVEAYRDVLKDKLVVMGEVPFDVAVATEQQADILLNIGNSVKNQVPSKIFEYISLGKKIINFTKFTDCPTKKYTKDYPAAIDIYENFEAIDESVEKIKSFAEKNIESVPYEQIEKLYKECTAPYVRKEIHRIMNIGNEA